MNEVIDNRKYHNVSLSRSMGTLEIIKRCRERLPVNEYRQKPKLWQVLHRAAMALGAELDEAERIKGVLAIDAPAGCAVGPVGEPSIP